MSNGKSQGVGKWFHGPEALSIRRIDIPREEQGRRIVVTNYAARGRGKKKGCLLTLIENLARK